MATTATRTRKTAAAAPAKTTAPTKRTSAKSAPVEDDDAPVTAAEMLALAKDIAGFIKSGMLDQHIGLLDSAIESRLKTVQPTTPAKVPAARSAQQKTAPVSRAKKTTEEPVSASAKTVESAEIAQKLMPAAKEYKVGAAYVIANSKQFHGAKVRVVEIDGAKAKVEFREEFIGLVDGKTRKVGVKLTIAAKLLVSPLAFSKMK